MTLSPRHRRVAIFAGVNLLLVLVGWLALIAPQQHAAAAAAAKADAAQTALAVLLGTTGSNKQPEIHTAGLYALDTALPAQEDLPDLLFGLDRLAASSGVRVLGISPQTAQATTTGYTIQPINLQLSGTYSELHGFLQRLRTLVSEHGGHLVANGPLFAVTSVSLTLGSKGHDLLATVGAAAFYYGITAGATPPASATDTSTTSTTGG